MKLTIAKQIYQDLRESIISGEIQPGLMLGENEMAEKYNSSKMPVREALHQLCQEGYLISYPRRGYVVTNITEEDFYEVQQVRLPLELLSVELVIEKASRDEIMGLYDILCAPELETAGKPTNSRLHNINSLFHLELARLSQNKRLYDSLSHLIAEVSRAGYRFYSPSILKERHFHERIIDALLEKDAEKAKILLREDLKITY
jgi:DNA-binding GntR family transcriptional regulator